jgi:PAS domain S-box-containing protein
LDIQGSDIVAYHLNRPKVSASFVVTLVLLIALIVTFWIYAMAEMALDRAREQRFTTLVLAHELRQSSDELTRMVRTYAVTGNPVFKTYYQDILAIRDGKKPRPAHYGNSYWDLVSAGQPPPPATAGRSVALLELIRQTGVDEAELNKLEEAKASSDRLSARELEIMTLIESLGANREADLSRARLMLFGDAYHEAKADIMRPIDEFISLTDRRARDAISAAEGRATLFRVVFVAFGLSLILMLWRSYRFQRYILGGSASEVHDRIVKLGQGDFSSSSPVSPARRQSVLGWLAETGRKLSELTQAQEIAAERYRRILSVSKDAFWLADADSGRLLDANDAAAAMLGYPLAQLRTMRIADFDVAFNPAEPQGRLVRIMAEGGGLFESRQRTAAGTVIDVEVSMSLDSKSRTLLAFLRDITARKQAEVAFRDSEEKFRLAFENANTGMCLVDLQGRLTKVNDKMSLIFGYSSHELEGMSVNDLAIPEDSALSPSFTQNAIQGIEVSRTFEKRYRHRLGHVITAEVASSMVSDSQGKPLYFISQVEDITRRKQAEQEIQALNARLEQRVAERTAQLKAEIISHKQAKEKVRAFAERLEHEVEVRTAQLNAANAALLDSEVRHRLVTDSMIDVVWIMDRDRVIIYVSPSVEKLRGYTSEETLKQSMAEILTPDSLGLAEEYLDGVESRVQAGDSPDSFRGELELFCKDGTTVAVETTASPLFGDDGSLLGIAGVHRDISARRRIEIALARERELLRQAEHMAQIGSWEWNVGIDSWMFSPSWLRLHGAEGCPPQTWDDLRAIAHPDDLKTILQALDDALERTGIYDLEHRIIRRTDGTIRSVRARGLVERDSRGQAEILYGVVQDITEQKQHEAQLRHAYLAAEKANAAKSEFLAHMSHEIRTPLNGLLGLVQIMSRENLTDDQREILSRLYGAGESLVHILNDILDLSKIEAGQLPIEQCPFELGLLLNKIDGIYRGRTHEAGLELRIDASLAPTGLLSGDARRLEQILANLVDNALKFTRQGTIIVGVKAIEAYETAVRLRFEVRDTGIGIAPETLSQLFTPFTQADTNITRRFGGTGLGLSISKRLAELMGGTIGVESRVGHGSLFWFELPLARAAENAQSEPPAPTPNPLAGPRLAGLHVLVVDDSAMNRELIEQLLALEGGRATSVADGEQAVDLLKTRSAEFDAVLMDVRMPVMDGLTATRVIRADLGLTDLPIIAVTAGVLAEQ